MLSGMGTEVGRYLAAGDDNDNDVAVELAEWKHARADAGDGY